MIRVRQIEVDINRNTLEELIYQTSKKLKLKSEEIKEIRINKKSIDARKKPNLKFIYEVDIKVDNEAYLLSKNLKDVLIAPDENYIFEITGNKKMNERPIIVGAGPAGLFCAYFLSLNGYKPIIIERGEKIEDRVKSVEEFWSTGNLNTNSNVQFGEGGAGTFSDGKLNTLSKDPAHRMKKVFEIFVANGANSDILYENKPHIGTDVLRKVIINMRNKIINMGAEFKFNTCLTDLKIENGKLVSIEVNNNEIIPCENLILAIGHSARDTFYMLNNYLEMTSKPFALGIRVQHPQEMINESQYGYKYHKELKEASYKLTYQASNKRGVYSFCMCPGGYVVNASSEKNRLAINGMSNYDRSSGVANSAIVVTVSPEDFGNNPLDGIEYQRRLEEKAFEIGKGKIPVQLWKDYKNNRLSNHLEFNPKFKGDYTFSNLNEILPNYINESLKEAIPYFGKKIRGYDREDAILAGIESRTSSPVRIIRNDQMISNIEGIYPCGEGAGYAGGITTAAMDGIKIAESIAKIYKPFSNK